MGVDMLLLCIAAGTMAESKALAITGGMEQSGITQPMMKESDVSIRSASMQPPYAPCLALPRHARRRH